MRLLAIGMGVMAWVLVAAAESQSPPDLLMVTRQQLSAANLTAAQCLVEYSSLQAKITDLEKQLAEAKKQ
jgi:hypothetical protein